MLYRLSYASKLRDRILSDANLPTDPFQMTGTILKGTINGKRRATNPLPRLNPSKSSPLIPSSLSFLHHSCPIPAPSLRANPATGGINFPFSLPETRLHPILECYH
jgi:hypothetical protein